MMTMNMNFPTMLFRSLLITLFISNEISLTQQHCCCSAAVLPTDKISTSKILTEQEMKMINEEECSVCYEELIDKCHQGHFLAQCDQCQKFTCEDCLEQWMNRQPQNDDVEKIETCPLCRYEIDQDELQLYNMQNDEKITQKEIRQKRIDSLPFVQRICYIVYYSLLKEIRSFMTEWKKQQKQFRSGEYETSANDAYVILNSQW